MSFRVLMFFDVPHKNLASSNEPGRELSNSLSTLDGETEQCLIGSAVLTKNEDEEK